MRRLALAALLVLVPAIGVSSHLTREDTSGREDRLEVRSYSLGMTDVATAAPLVRALLSPEGLLVEDKANRRLVVHDRPEVHRRIASALRSIELAPAHVRITVTHEFDRSERHDQAGVGVGARRDGVTIGVGRDAPPRGIGLRGQSSRTTSHGTSQQQVLVLSGSRASIAVAEQVPYSDWFWTWGTAHGLWSGEAQWVPSASWRDVGASLLVEPVVLDGGLVRVRLTPQFSYFLDRQRLTTEVQELTTELVVRAGEEIDVGGLPVSDREFLERFLFGLDRYGQTQRVRIRLRATVEKPALS